MKTTPAFKQTIRDYLVSRAMKDPLFAKIVQKPGKNMDDCITYILNTVKNSGCSGFTDDEVYNMAIHYFDEDNINVGSKMDCQVVVNHTVHLTEEEKAEAKVKAIEELKNEIKKKMRAKPTSTTVEKKEDDKKIVTETKPVEQSLF
jgi:hypothetical protein